MEANVLKLAREQTYDPYPAIIPLPEHITPTANFAPKLPPKRLKSHHSSALSVPARAQGPDGSLIPFKVVMHAGKPSPYAYPPVTYAKNEEERNQIVREDTANAHAQMGIVHFKKDVIKVDPKLMTPTKDDLSSSLSFEPMSKVRILLPVLLEYMGTL